MSVIMMCLITIHRVKRNESGEWGQLAILQTIGRHEDWSFL